MKNCKICNKEIDHRGTRCNTCVSKMRRKKVKLLAVEYKGGSCIQCGYNQHIAALEFHHTNPNEKEFNFGDVKNRKWETIKQELDKCVLLCSNCHRIEHSDYY